MKIFKDEYCILVLYIIVLYKNKYINYTINLYIYYMKFRLIMVIVMVMVIIIFLRNYSLDI